MVVKHNRRSTWRNKLRKPRDTPLGGRCGEITEIEGREPTIRIWPHLSRHHNSIRKNERQYLEARRKKVRRYVTTWPWESTQLRGPTKSRKERVRPKVGNVECVLLYMRRWDENEMMSTYPGVSQIYTPRLFLRLYLEATIDRIGRCNWRPRLSELWDALRCSDQTSLEMHLEAVIEQDWRCNWRPRLSEPRDALGGHKWASLDMH